MPQLTCGSLKLLGLQELQQQSLPTIWHSDSAFALVEQRIHQQCCLHVKTPQSIWIRKESLGVMKSAFSIGIGSEHRDPLVEQAPPLRSRFLAEIGDDDFSHCHHGFPCFFGFRRVTIAKKFSKLSWGYLPTHSKSVFTPATLTLGATI